MTNWIVCIARNALPLTKAAVASFLAQDIPVRVLLINNASTDNTGSWMVANSGKIYSMHFAAQRSVAECWNYALQWIWKVGDTHAMVCNNDVEIVPDAYSKLLGYSTGQHVPFVTCVSVNTEKQVRDFDALSWSYHVREHPDFSCFLIQKEVTDRIGYFDEGMKIAYCEDSDYHVRMHRAGIKAVCVDIPFLHHGASTVKLADEAEAQRIREQADHNRERFYQKYGARIGTPEYEALFSPETFGKGPL